MTQPHDQRPESFRSAVPIWPRGTEKQWNLFVGFRAVVAPAVTGRTVVRVAAASLYRLYVNGVFRGHGPARGPHGFFRVDEWELTDQLARPGNVIAVEVAGYNVNSYYLLDQPSFLQAEIVCEGRTLASTGGAGERFTAAILDGRVQKVQRYSKQRTFSEIYQLDADSDRWRHDLDAPFDAVDCAAFSPRKLLPRRVPYPTFATRRPTWHVACGEVATDVPIAEPWRDRSLTMVGPTYGGFPEQELASIPSLEMQGVVTRSRRPIDRPICHDLELTCGPDAYHILDFSENLSGFIGATVHCEQPARFFFVFDEILTDGDVDFKRLRCVNIVAYELAAGTHVLESFEPYTLRYLKIVVLRGSIDVTGVYLRQLVNPSAARATFSCDDPAVNRLFEAGRSTFSQNAVDLPTDCPSRERAAWLCDSFFICRVEPDLTGGNVVERNFIEGFALPQSFAPLPRGMLPKCYPADSDPSGFLPTWAMWFVLQLEEYLHRSGDQDLINALRDRVTELFAYFQPFRNEIGLLEKLDGVPFIEWSKANEFVQDVSFPANMLYAAALDAAGRLYGMAHLSRQAQSIREQVLRLSFDGEFFVDNAVREAGALKVTCHRTEICQYFAFYFDLASPQSHPELWRTLRDEFGPCRRSTNRHPRIHHTNTFVGEVLRLELLSRYGHGRQLLAESKDYFLFMAEQTGTLWEHNRPEGSCCHGFASHIVHCIYRDLLGVHRLDVVDRVVHLRWTDVPLTWCEGRLPTPAGEIHVHWWKEDTGVRFRVHVPAGYRLKIPPGALGEVVQVA